MNDPYLVSLVERIQNLDGERQKIALMAFDQLATIDPEIWDLAKATFSDETIAAKWFSEPVDSLGHEVPLAHLLNGNRQDLINCLKQIQHGLFA